MSNSNNYIFNVPLYFFNLPLFFFFFDKHFFFFAHLYGSKYFYQIVVSTVVVNVLDYYTNKPVRTPDVLLYKYPWEKYEPPYPSSYVLPLLSFYKNGLSIK